MQQPIRIAPSILSADLTREQVMDLVMTVGFYTMTAMALNSFGVTLEPGA